MTRAPNPPARLDLYAAVGDTVLWYAGGNETPHPLVGMVIEKSPGGAPDTMNLTIATFTGSGFAVQEGVLHMDNPKCRQEGNAGGGWRHRPLEFALRQVLHGAGVVVWDGDEDYVAAPDFDAAALGRQLADLMPKPAAKAKAGAA